MHDGQPVWLIARAASAKVGEVVAFADDGAATTRGNGAGGYTFSCCCPRTSLAAKSGCRLPCVQVESDILAILRASTAPKLPLNFLSKAAAEHPFLLAARLTIALMISEATESGRPNVVKTNGLYTIPACSSSLRTGSRSPIFLMRIAWAASSPAAAAAREAIPTSKAATQPGTADVRTSAGRSLGREWIRNSGSFSADGSA